ncbi:unnamed protein product [Prorocentrum cordatum]|uniref:Uncharacterized protein n=1 Tax=Prorocentrum cordatum TaxID=2364126 RepID=A0ABN9PVI7_9DINO|nr:unnamed protein product [Polarella glacialis]
MARSSRGGGSGSRRSRTYWMCSSGGWNWDWRTTCLGCGHAAPPWALEAAAAKAKPQADKDGWVDQPRGRRAQRQARSAATCAATSKSQASASGDSGTPSGSGATAIERLQVAVEQLEALQAEPPDGVDCCFTDVVASQLRAKRAELAEGQRAAAEQKASSMPLPMLLHKELQKAQEELAQLDAEVEEASRALHVLEEEARVEAAAQLRQRAAEWAGASQVPGLLMQLDKLPEAWGPSNFEVAWAAIRSQVEAVRAQLAEAPAVPRRVPWAESCPMDEISSEGGDLAGGSGPWQPQCAVERGQAERRGDARGELPKVAQACKRELAAEAEARGHGSRARSHARGAKPWQQEGGGAEAARIGGKRPLDLGSAQAPPAPGQAATAAQDVRSGLEELGINGNALRRGLEVIEASDSRNGAPPHLVMLQETRLAPHSLEEARGAARRMGYTAFLHASAPTDKEGPLANSGGVAALVRSDLQAAVIAWQAPSDLRHCMIGLNLDILAAFGDTVLHQSPRFISFVGLATGSCSTNGAVLAGCAYATTVAKLPVLAALRAASAGGRPLVVARNVVSDIALQTVGTEQLVAARLGSAGLEVARRVRGQTFPLSAARATFLASRPSLGRQRGECGKSQGWTFRKTLQAGNLGTDAANTRRGVHDGRVRAAGALRRARRLGCLRAAGVEVDPIHKAGPTASMAWGRTVTGNADGELHRWRLAACRSAGALPMGAERWLRMRCAELRRRRDLDPAALTAGHAVQMMAGLLQTGELPPRVMERGLEAAATSHARADTPWKHCASPFDAVVLTRARIDWHFKPERCMVTDIGDELGLVHLGSRELDLEAGLGARRASLRHEMRKLSHDTHLQRPLHWDAIADDKLNGKLYLGGSALEPQFGALRCAGWAIAQCDDDGNLGAGVYGTVWRDRCPQQTAKDGRAYATAPGRANAHLWCKILAAFEPGAFEVKKVPAPCSRQAALDGLLAEAQRRGNEHADRLAEMGAKTHAVDRLTVGVHHALAEIAQDTQELVACSKCGAYMTLGGRSGVRPRLKERCPGEGIPALRSQGPVPEHAQERYLEWPGTAAEPAVDSSATASSAGSAPAAAAEPQAFGVTEEEFAAAAGAAVDALEDRRVRRRMARRGGPTVSE